MWGQILLESSTQQNFNFGFSTHKSDILIHLSQWQYWWWFWFALVWVAYYYVVVYCVTRRTSSFNPVINTSLRGHGKWGDFLVVLIPLSWCGNILVNSNFILRMIEWQNESSLFTLRIQGKQWYWVYKFDATANTSILSAPKNLGNNRWANWFANDIYISDSYYQAIHLASKLEFQDTYKTLLSKAQNTKYTFEQNNLLSNKISNVSSLNQLDNSIKNSNFMVNVLSGSSRLVKLSNLVINEGVKTTYNKSYNLIENKFFLNNMGELDYKYNLKLSNLNKFLFSHYDLNKVDDVSDTMGNIRLNNTSKSLRLLKTPLNLYFLENTTNFNLDLFSLKYNTSNDVPSEKVYQTETLWGFRQKKYKRLKKFLYTPRISYNPKTFEALKNINKNLPLTQRNIYKNQINFVEEGNYNLNMNDTYIKNYLLDTDKSTHLNIPTSKKIDLDSHSTSFDYYKAIKNSKHRSDLLPVTLARRLLRVKRTLVLPAHVNITVITNSYDVVHSWFIPGLGLKLDCVPGRSTHHTFYVDNVGLYYGQCAEICGRYHHHMPIRICALPFDQFVVWWNKKGLPRLNRLNVQGNIDLDSKYYNILHKNRPVLENQYTVPSKATLYKYNW